MKNLFQSNWGLLLILIPLGVFIFFIDNLMGEEFLSPNSTSNHFFFIGSLVCAVLILLGVILKIDNNSK